MNKIMKDKTNSIIVTFRIVKAIAIIIKTMVIYEMYVI